MRKGVIMSPIWKELLETEKNTKTRGRKICKKHEQTVHRKDTKMALKLGEVETLHIIKVN